MSNATHNAVAAALELIDTGQTQAARDNLRVLEMSLRHAGLDSADPVPVLVTKHSDAELFTALELLRAEVDSPPEKNCSCHISPPCGSCSYNGLREAIAAADAAMDAHTNAANNPAVVYVAVPRAPLVRILRALHKDAPSHLIRELQFLQGPVDPDNPITVLCNQLQLNGG